MQRWLYSLRADEDVNYYKHLGSEMGPGFTGGQDRVRAKVVARCTGGIGVIGGIKGLGVTAMNDAIESAVGGIVDYYGRACILTWEDMQKVEMARASAIQRATGIWMVLHADYYGGRRRWEGWVGDTCMHGRQRHLLTSLTGCYREEEPSFDEIDRKDHNALEIDPRT